MAKSRVSFDTPLKRKRHFNRASGAGRAKIAAPMLRFQGCFRPRRGIMLSKSLKLFAAAWLAAFATGAFAQTVKIGVVLPYTGRRRRVRPAGGPRHADVHEAESEGLRALQGRDHQARLEVAERRGRQGRGAGTRRPGESGHPDRLHLLPGRDRFRGAVYRSQEAGGDHERGHRLDHQSFADDLARLVLDVARRLRDGRGGGQDRQGEDRGDRLHRFSAGQGQPGRVQARF